MSVQVKGSGTIGGLDEGLVVSGIVTSSTQVNVGSNIKLGNAGVITATSYYGDGSNLTGVSGVTIADQTNNELITCSGTTDALNSETNLTFDGTNFSVTGAANVAGTLILQPGGTAWSTTNTRPQLGRQADGELRLGAGSDSSSIVTLYTSPSAGGTLAERLKITSTGILVTGGGTAPSSTDLGSIFMPGGGDLGWLTSSGSITFNAYYNGGWKYVTSGTSHILWASSEGFNFSTASSGSANGAISYSRAMKIFTNNRVSIGDGNSGSPLAALHIDTKSTMGTDTALWIGDNANKRYMNIQQVSNSEQFSHMELMFNDNGTRAVLQLKNPYAPAGYGTGIVWKGYNNGDQGYIECKSEGANSANATMYLNTSGGTFLQANHAKHIRMPSQPSFAAYRNQSTWNVNGAVMVFNTTRHNIGNHYDTSNGRFTAPIAGSYQINFFSIYRGNHTNAYVQLYKNGARINGGDIHFTYYDLGTNWDNVSFSQVISLSTGDYLTMYSPSNVDWHGNHWQLFSGYLLG